MHSNSLDFKRYSLACMHQGQIPAKRPCLLISLTNNSDRIIYLDLANTFIIRNKSAEPYYIPSAKGSTDVSTTSAGVGFGIMSIGSSNSTASTQMTYSQRIVSIPAHSSIDLEPHALLPDDYHIEDVIRSDKSPWDFQYCFMINTKNILGLSELNSGKLYEFENGRQPCTFGFRLTYGFDESFSYTKMMSSTLYLKQIIGTGTINALFSSMKANMLTDNWVESLTFPCIAVKD